MNFCIKHPLFEVCFLLGLQNTILQNAIYNKYLKVALRMLIFQLDWRVAEA